MTKREYFRQNQKVILLLFKLIGVVATSIIAILFILTSFHFKSLMDVLYLFLICFVLGNMIAFSLVLLYFSLNYNPFKDLTEFYRQLNEEFKIEYKVTLYKKPLVHKYSLTEIALYCIHDDYYFEIRSDRAEKKIRIILFYDLEKIDFTKAFKEINSNYAKDSISLTGTGLIKEIKLKQWKEINSMELKVNLLELEKVSEAESLEARMQKKTDD